MTCMCFLHKLHDQQRALFVGWAISDKLHIERNDLAAHKEDDFTLWNGYTVYYFTIALVIQCFIAIITDETADDGIEEFDFML